MSLEPDQLAPGVRRLRPDDHFMMLSETDSSPMHVGALVMLAVPEAEQDAFYDRIRAHLAERLPATPLQTRLVQAPDGYDSDVWVDVAAIDLDYHVTRLGGVWSEEALRIDVARRSLERLDLGRAPFRIFAYERVEGGRAALYIKSHHALADGIGFQTLLMLLSDATLPAPPRTADGALPAEAAWRALADERFSGETSRAEVHRSRRKEALAALEALKQDPATKRPRTPVLKMSGPTAPERVYATLSLPFGRIKALAKTLDGTINDLFLAICASAVRRVLIDLDDLPDTPIVLNSARSYRRPEHGAFGNRIVALHPHIATTVADPIERLRAIQAEMRREMARTTLDEAMLDQPEKPHGARDRRAKFAERTGSGTALLPGNITLSNVPGPAEELYYAGFAQLGNFPVPILGLGRFLNITSRRNADRLDMGVMADPTRIADVDTVARYVAEALEEYAALAPA